MTREIAGRVVGHVNIWRRAAGADAASLIDDRALPGAGTTDAFGYTFFFVGSDPMLPFATTAGNELKPYGFAGGARTPAPREGR
jgi:hypothetical protein